MTKEEYEQKLQDLMLQPKEVEIDDKTVKQHDLSEVIEFDKYLASKKAFSKRHSGLKITKMESGHA